MAIVNAGMAMSLDGFLKDNGASHGRNVSLVPCRQMTIKNGGSMDQNLLARAITTIDAPRERVWDALVNPEAIKQYMFGTNVVSDWRETSPIVWKGEWQGRPYEDKGMILRLKPGHVIQYSHFSPLSGLPDKPENYHIVTIELSDDADQTRVLLTQDRNATEEERDHSEKNWGMMLAALKKYLEQ